MSTHPIVDETLSVSDRALLPCFSKLCTYPGEDITIDNTNFFANMFWAYAGRESKIRAELYLDEMKQAECDVYITRISGMEYRGSFSFSIRVPYAVGPYTYWVKFFNKRWGWQMYLSDPISIEVVPYACPYCGAVFSTPEELEAHIITCPERPPAAPEWKRYLPYISVGLLGLGLVLLAVSR